MTGLKRIEIREWNGFRAGLAALFIDCCWFGLISWIEINEAKKLASIIEIRKETNQQSKQWMQPVASS